MESSSPPSPNRRVPASRLCGTSMPCSVASSRVETEISWTSSSIIKFTSVTLRRLGLQLHQLQLVSLHELFRVATHGQKLVLRRHQVQRLADQRELLVAR